MALPVIKVAIALGALGMAGVKKILDAGLNLNKAKNVNKLATKILERDSSILIEAKQNSQFNLEELGKLKIEILDNSIQEFINIYEQLNNVDVQDSIGLQEINKFRLDKQSITELKEIGEFATSIAGGIASGAVGGAIAAFGAYGAAGWLASASTGTAIAALHGAAATNATLAFFGGGAIAAGGYGIAGGMVILGGIIAAPALAIMGIIVDAKANKEKDEAYINLAIAKKNAAELRAATSLCDAISLRCQMFYDVLDKLNKLFIPTIKKMSDTIINYGSDYSSFSIEEQNNIVASMSLAGAIKAVLDTPLLNKNGELTIDSENILKEIEERKFI